MTTKESQLNPRSGVGCGDGYLGTGVRVHRPDALLDGCGAGVVRRLGYGVVGWLPYPVMISNYWAIWHPSLRGADVAFWKRDLCSVVEHKRWVNFAGCCCRKGGQPRSVSDAVLGRGVATPVGWLAGLGADGVRMSDLGPDAAAEMFGLGKGSDEAALRRTVLPDAGWYIRLDWGGLWGARGHVDPVQSTTLDDEGLPRPVLMQMQPPPVAACGRGLLAWWEPWSLDFGTSDVDAGAKRLRKMVSASDDACLWGVSQWISMPAGLALLQGGLQIWGPAAVGTKGPGPAPGRALAYHRMLLVGVRGDSLLEVVGVLMPARPVTPGCDAETVKYVVKDMMNLSKETEETKEI